MSSDLSLRFGGIHRLYGADAMHKLSNAHFAVVGIGGVGSWAVEGLARTGVGRLTLIDLDDVCVTNVNRQLHAMSNTVGNAKIDVMAERIAQINPECKVTLVEDFVTQDNLHELISTDIDVVIDAIDAVQVKAALIAHCKRQKITVVTTGGAGGQIDPTQITIADVSKTIQDPLMAKVKSVLKRDYGFSKNPKRKFGVDCVFSTEQLRYPQADGEVCHQKSQREGSARLDCQGGFGAVTMVTASFGFFAASRGIEKFLRRQA